MGNSSISSMNDVSVVNSVVLNVYRLLLLLEDVVLLVCVLCLSVLMSVSVLLVGVIGVFVLKWVVSVVVVMISGFWFEYSIIEFVFGLFGLSIMVFDISVWDSSVMRRIFYSYCCVMFGWSRKW